MLRPSQNYPPEMPERAIRMVAEVRENYPSEAAAMEAVSAKLGCRGVRRCASGFAGLRSMLGSVPV
jgi:hypothetical protein